MPGLGKTQIMTIGVAAILIIAGVCVFMLKDDNSNPPVNNVESTLALYGNANGDLEVDTLDLSLIDEIIAGEKMLRDYPLADANKDGEVTSADKEIVNKVINEQPCTVNVVSLTPEGAQTYASVSYPLKNVVPFGTNMLTSLINAGGADYTAGVFKIGYDNAEVILKTKVDAGDIKNYGATNRSVSDKVFNAFTAHDGELINAGEGGIGALLLDHSASTFDERYDALDAAGIPVIRLAVADPYEEIGCTLLIGYLMGGTAKSTALNYSVESLKVINEVQRMVSSLTDATKNTYISITMGKYVCENNSTYNQAGKYGGGLAYYMTNEAFARAYVGDGSAMMNSGEALSNFDDADFVLSNRTIDVKSNPGEVLVEDWDKYKSFFVNLDCYENLVYVNNLLPGAVKIAFVAAIVSSDKVSMDYAEEVLEKFTGIAKSLNGVTVENTLIIGTYEDYKAAGGTS